VSEGSNTPSRATQDALLRPAWRRARFWLAIAVALVLAALAVTALTGTSNRALDPASSAPDGSKALATLLRSHGVRVHTSTHLGGARGRVVVTDPDSYTAGQLRALSHRAELVLLGGSERSLSGLDITSGPAHLLAGPVAPGCDWAGATSAGVVDLPPGTLGYPDGTRQPCYDGALLRGAGWAVLGSSRLLRNDTVARDGIAALDVNVLTDDLTVRDLTWLLPGTEATGSAAPTAWARFPDGARRAFVWLAVLGVLLVLWRARRFGPVVSEPLPVVVRAAELVEGHGRLYQRARAREHAAAALRAGAVHRLGARLGSARGTPLPALAQAIAVRTGRPEATVHTVLAGPAPVSDADLVDLALALDDLDDLDDLAELHAVSAESDVPVPPSKGTP
jgi:hypothetical protein